MNGQRKTKARRGRKARQTKTIPLRSWADAEFKIPIPKDERQRLMALKHYDILDTPPEQTFDDITTLAADICKTPISLIVLIDEDRQWFKSKVGVELEETPRELAFCNFTIIGRDLMMVDDTIKDRRFDRNPLVVAGPRVRFYAGAPLITPDNRALGTLCVIDRVPRKLTLEQQRDLVALSRLVMTQIELRRTLFAERKSKSRRKSQAALKRFGFKRR